MSHGNGALSVRRSTTSSSDAASSRTRPWHRFHRRTCRLCASDYQGNQTHSKDKHDLVIAQTDDKLHLSSASASCVLIIPVTYPLTQPGWVRRACGRCFDKWSYDDDSSKPEPVCKRNLLFIFVQCISFSFRNNHRWQFPCHVCCHHPRKWTPWSVWRSLISLHSLMQNGWRLALAVVGFE